MNVWFTSDTHFGHTRLREYYPGRAAFSDVESLDEWLIERWNAQVKPRDMVYHLGDFGCKDIAYCIRVLRRLNGKIHLVPGNHDQKLIRNEEFTRQLTELYPYSYREISVQRQMIVLSHFPLWEWNQCFRGAWHLHGHLHGRAIPVPGKRLDVGIDGQDYRPVSFEEVAEWMLNQGDYPRVAS